MTHLSLFLKLSIQANFLILFSILTLHATHLHFYFFVGSLKNLWQISPDISLNKLSIILLEDNKNGLEKTKKLSKPGGSNFMGIRIRPREIDITEEEPFRNDLLDRKESVEVLTHLIESIEGPCVLAVDAAWGTGKTTFLAMWAHHLRKIKFPCS